jgi:hypothetical protein
MSGAATTPASAQPGRLIRRRARPGGLNPLEALERGFALFQSTFAREGWRYYVGAAPLVLSFIPIWIVNGQIRVSDGLLFMETALLATAYLVRVALVSSYMRGVRERAFGAAKPRVAGGFARAAALGRLLAWKITLGISSLATLPTVAGAPWFYSASQFAALEVVEDASERHSPRGCLGLAGQWYGAGILFFLACFPLWCAVWLNGFILALIVPQLLHSIFGVNTLLSTAMGMYALLRSSAFWLSLFAAAWLALDPIIKCTFVIVHQHLRSRTEGDDLRALLASLPRQQQQKSEMISSPGRRQRAVVGSVAILSVLMLVGSQTRAKDGQISPHSGNAVNSTDLTQQVRVEKLREALEAESQRAIYRWHDAEHPTPPTWFDRLLSRIGRGIERGWNALTRFLRKLWPRGLTVSGGKEKGSGWQLKDFRLWLALVGGFTLAVAGLLFWLRRRRELAEVAVPLAIAALPDLSNTAVASERSEDEWFSLAERLEGEGDLRLAVRAAYLGLLAGLAQREWLTIRRDRTNREYLDEFTRRWRRRPQAAAEARVEIPEKLRGSLRLFDRVWYGSYSLTPTTVAAYRQGQRELLNHV